MEAWCGENEGENTVYNDQFEVRLARVRHRFATTLESKVKDAVVSAEAVVVMSA